jgi:class 3 adenylate cyclase/tetratricopeptide (TPR) repeat protein
VNEVDIANWLSELGLGEYAQRFAENGIDLSVLAELTDHDFERLGVLLGHRRKILRAIGVLAHKVSRESFPQDDAERRQVAVMFCDLVGSTELAHQFDVEDLREVIGTYHRCCARVIKESGGFVARYMGDGVLAYFGYPQAHEDDVERATRAGLALVEAVAKLGVRGGTPLRARVGIATGVVVVGESVGEGAAQEQAIVGESPNLAARLQALAEPDTVIIDRNTRRLLGELFEYRPMGRVSIKGFAEPMPVWLVIGPSVVDSRFEALRAATTPLVGREEEIELLMRRWEQAKEGSGRVVLISGEPGIGKSRIAEAILEHMSDQSHTRLRYFCSPHHQNSAFYPIIRQIQRVAGFRRDDKDEQRLGKLETVLSLGTDDLRDVVPLLADLMSLPTGRRYPPLNLSPQKQKEKTLDATAAHVAGLAIRRPALVIFEDVHWIDPTSREFLEILIDRVSSSRILVIITFRPEFTPQWIGRPHVTLLSLSRLASPQRAEMIRHLTAGKALPKEITDQIIDRTDGVPLFIEELVKAVLESGMLTDSGDRYTLAEALPPVVIPNSLHASLLARLDRSAAVREVAQIAAALGRQFSHELISAISPMGQEQLNDALARLVDTELIYQRGSPPHAEYTFKHALVQDAAYSTLLRRRRLQLHGQIAAALEGRFTEIVETQPEVLARHCAEAGLIDKAIDYRLKAGRQAITKWAMTEAVAELRKGLDLLSRAGDGVMRHEQELNLQMALGQALLATSGYSAPEPGEVYERARHLCEQAGRSAQLGPILYGQFVFRLVRGELRQAEHYAEEMCHLGELHNDLIWKCLGSRVSGVVFCVLGKFVEARIHSENALALWDAAYRATAAAPADPHVSALLYLSRTLLCLGYVDQARVQRDKALTEARLLSPFTLAYGLYVAWASHWAIEGTNSAQAMLRAADEVLAISSEQSFPLLLGFGNIMRGWSMATEGQAKGCIPLLLKGLAIYRSTGAHLALPFVLTTLAETYGRARLPEDGLNCLAEAARVIEMTQERWAEAEMHRLRGNLLLCLNNVVAAEDSYHKALAVAQHQSAKFWELRAATSLGQLWRDQGKHAAARQLLVPVYEWFTEGLETPALREAKGLLGQLA